MSDNALERQRLLKVEAARQEAEIDRLRSNIGRLSTIVTAFREQDDAIRAEFGGKRDGRPTIECLREAFAAKWSEEDTLFKATLDMKTGELRAEVARLAAENERLRAEVEQLKRDKAEADEIADEKSFIAQAFQEASEDCAENIARVKAALREIETACKNPGSWSEIVMERIIERVEEIARTALQDKSDE